MSLAINVQTKEGIAVYESIHSMVRWSKKHDMLEWMRQYLSLKGVAKEKEFIDWSDKQELDDLNDPRWHEWKVKADEVACYNYFSRGKQ